MLFDVRRNEIIAALLIVVVVAVPAQRAVHLCGELLFVRDAPIGIGIEISRPLLTALMDGGRCHGCHIAAIDELFGGGVVGLAVLHIAHLASKLQPIVAIIGVERGTLCPFLDMVGMALGAFVYRQRREQVFFFL